MHKRVYQHRRPRVSGIYDSSIFIPTSTPGFCEILALNYAPGAAAPGTAAPGPAAPGA